MYTTSEEARSDLFLAGAVYVLGPLVVNLVLGLLPLDRVPVVALALALLLPLVYTVLVPVLLMRYRKERLADFGYAGSRRPLLTGLLVGAPIAAAAVVSGLLASGAVAGAVPVLTGVLDAAYFELAVRILKTLGLMFLAIYCTTKARDAFRGDPAYMRAAAWQVGRFVAIAGGIATLLLLANQVAGDPEVSPLATFVLQPLGVAGAVWLALRSARDSRLTSRPTLLTPMILLAIGSFTVFASPTAIVFGIWRAAMLAGIGLAVGVMLESDRSAWGPIGLAIVLALLSYLPS
jgi:hypothetical protein